MDKQAGRINRNELIYCCACKRDTISAYCPTMVGTGHPGQGLDHKVDPVNIGTMGAQGIHRHTMQLRKAYPCCTPKMQCILWPS